ncbi:MAG: sugar phosphate isomerase/epimerase [Planctomycetes bacterium]|nr:sugar phosphate isomerase/epimerase [Planctomycetota bacterium]
MLLGYHTNSLQNHRLDDALGLLAQHGYEAVAITPDVCHLDPDAVDDAALASLRRRLEELSLTPVMETGARFLLDPATKHEPTLMTRDRARRDRRVAFYRRTAAIGRQLGAEVVSFWAGIDRAPGADSADWLCEGVEATCAAIRAEGLRPSMEPEPGMAVETVADWRRLRDRLGASAPELTLDVGHLYAVDEGDPVEVIRAAAPFLAQVHLEDHRSGVHEHLLPGDGDVDFESVLRTLREVGYRGPACFELSRHSHCAPSALTVCRDVWTRHVGGSRR